MNRLAGIEAVSWASLFPLKEDEHSRGGTSLFRGEHEFHYFSGKVMTLVSLYSWLVVSSLGTSGTHRVLTVNAKVKNVASGF